MVERSDIGSWLEGQHPGANTQSWPGERLGLPEHGPGSLGRLGRRIGALAVDWGIALLISHAGFHSNPWATMGAFAVGQVLLVGTLGYSIGYRLLGLRLRRVSGALPGPAPVLLRTILLCLVIPAVVWDADRRGLHDKAAGTILVRT